MSLQRRLFSAPRAKALALGAVALLAFQGVGFGSTADFDAEKKIQTAFIEALTVVEDHYSTEVDYERLSEAAVNGMLTSLDPHSHFYNREAFLEFRTRQRSQYSGIGASIIQHQGKVFIQSPIGNTPAYRAGLRYGDHIVAIDGQSAQGWGVDKVRNNLRGLRGTPVTVTVERPGSKDPLSFRIVRDSVAQPAAPNIFMIRPGIGYIGVREFQQTAGDEVADGIKALKARGAQQYILDLRDNPGGLVEAARVMLEQFLPRGQKLVTIKGRGRNGVVSEVPILSQNTDPDLSPLVVMINNGSASASEIVSGALQDHDRALLVGETSFGKGLVQTPYQLSDGCGLTLTSAKYYTPSGRLIQRNYEGVSLYDYQKAGYTGTGAKPTGNNNTFQTDGNRTVQGGSGIEPDIRVSGRAGLTVSQARLLDATFAFGRLLTNGQIPGFPEYAVGAAQFEHVLSDQDFAVSDKLMQEFLKFTGARLKEFDTTDAILKEQTAFIREQLRRELVTAAYGTDTAVEITLSSDPQLAKAIAEFDKAKKLAEDGRKRWQNQANSIQLPATRRTIN